MSKNTPTGDEDDVISESEAAELIGKHIVVGLTFVDADQKPIRLTQLHGFVVRVNRKEGIVLRQSDGSEYNLPPSLAGFEKAPEGSSCTLHSTGEVVDDPDYLVSYTVNQYH
jgi:hypothetical protein